VTEHTKRRFAKGAVLSFIGFLLSPLSWWNDLFINIPLAYLFALPFSLLSEQLFFPAMIVGYWITNVVGLLLMHYGVGSMVGKTPLLVTKVNMTHHVLLTLLYTSIVTVCIYQGWITLPF